MQIFAFFSLDYINMNTPEKKIEESNKKEIWFSKTNDIAEMLDSETIWVIKEMIWVIENEKLRSNFEYYFLTERIYGEKKLQEEIWIYQNDIKPRLSDDSYVKLVDFLLSNSRSKKLPSGLKKEFDIYGELMSKTEPDEVKIISRYLDAWFIPSLVMEEYQVYVEIKNLKFKSDEMKNYLISLMQSWTRPQNIDHILDLFLDKPECTPETQKYVKSLLNDNSLFM